MEQAQEPVLQADARHGSNAVYRFDKITKCVFEEIAKGGYVAQECPPASERIMQIEGLAEPRKVDVRLYAHAGGMVPAPAQIIKGRRGISARSAEVSRPTSSLGVIR